jgi:peptidoglycan-associated lipoprotein
MTIDRRLSLMGLFCLTAASVALTGCPSTYPDCDDDSVCAEYNSDDSSDGFNRGHTVCVDGVCRECRANGDCAWNEDCVANVCELDPDRCRNTNDCPAGQFCEGDTCRAGCDDVHGCPEGQLCQNNACVRDPDWCNLDSDCAEGYRCENHRCIVSRPCADRQFDVVYFDFDESVIRVDQEPRLEANAECLNAFPSDSIRIEGHCDERGTDAYNLALGERRARSSKRHLERLGVNADRMDIISYGESRPTCRQSNESCWRDNRRTEFVWR